MARSQRQGSPGTRPDSTPEDLPGVAEQLPSTAGVASYLHSLALVQGPSSRKREDNASFAATFESLVDKPYYVWVGCLTAYETKEPMHSPTTSKSQPSTQTMRAMVYTRYGLPRDVLTLSAVERPVPDADSLLIRVHAASLNALDWRLITGTPFIARVADGIRRPSRHIPGADISGTVEAVGESVSEFSAGEEIFAEIPGGGFAEFVTVPADRVALKPANLSLEESATLGVAALTALQGLRDWGNMQPGQRVLVNGASGGVGTFAIQIARALGASHVTAVCSTDKMEIARSLGADLVIDYTKEDFTKVAPTHDILFDNAGMRPFSECRRVIEADGTHVVITGPMHKWFGPMRRIIWSALRAMPGERKFVGGKTAQQSTADLNILKAMVEAGSVKPVMDRRFSLEDAVAALHYQGDGHARGKSLVLPSGDSV